MNTDDAAPEIAEYMKPKPHMPPNPRRRGSNETNLRKMITEIFRFSSDPEQGLELADIVVNATRQAMIGNLGMPGWQHPPPHDSPPPALHRRHRVEKGAGAA